MALFVFAGYLVRGQGTPQTGARSTARGDARGTEPTFSISVDGRSADLAVHDKHHKAVLDLKPEDITITDEGTPVKLNAFHLVRGDATSGHMITLVFIRSVMEKTDATVVDDPGSEVVTNGVEYPAGTFVSRGRRRHRFRHRRRLAPVGEEVAEA